MPFSCMQQNIQQIVSPQRVSSRRSIGGSSTLFSGLLTTFNGILLDTYCSYVVIQSSILLYYMLS
jgi:hypothetical protein